LKIFDGIDSRLQKRPRRKLKNLKRKLKKRKERFRFEKKNLLRKWLRFIRI